MTADDDEAWANCHSALNQFWLSHQNLTRVRDGLVAQVEVLLAEDPRGGNPSHIGKHLGVSAEWADITTEMALSRAREMPIDELIRALRDYEDCGW